MKMLKIILLIFLITLLLSQDIFALSEISETATNFLETGTANANMTIDSKNLRDKSGDIYNMFLAVATAVAVVVGAMLGIQFMTAGIDKKVEVKESIFPYIVSCIVVFGSMGIWKLVVTVLGNF